MRPRNATVDAKIDYSEDEEDDFHEKRKVAIDDNKNEYFEYSRGSAANSSIASGDDETRSKKLKRNKGKFKSKYMRKDINLNQKNIKRRFDEMRKRTKSLSSKNKEK